MENIIPFPVTPESFAQCWDYVDRRRRIAMRRSVLAKVGGLVINLFFLCTLIFVCNGLIYTYLRGSYCRYLGNLAPFMTLWKPAAKLLQISGSSLAGDACKLLIAAYLVSALAFGLLSALIHLVYHPRKKEVPTLSYAENTALLAKLAHSARDHAYRTRLVTSIVATVLAIIVIVVLFFAYALDLQDAARLTRIMTTFPFPDVTINSLLYVLFLYMVSNFFSTPFLFLTRPIYYYDFPYELVIQAERAALFAREDDSSLTPEALTQQHKENAAALREQAVELEKISAYSKAKELFFTAAVAGDTAAMEHYARHCLLTRLPDSARYWLNACAAQPDASEAVKKILFQLKLGLRPDVHYLNFEKTRKNPFLVVLSVFFRLFMLVLFVLSLYYCYAYFDSIQNPGAHAQAFALLQKWTEPLKAFFEQ